MANFKRRKSRRSIRCTLCTPHRWRGNSRDRFKPRERAARERAG
jgi:hypothetical protein